jgi:hypothetical protein
MRRTAACKFRQEDAMRKNLIQLFLMSLAFSFLGLLPLQAQEKPFTATTPVQMAVTVRVLGENKRTPEVNREDVIVRQGKNRLQVTGWMPAGGDQAPLDLFILIDDAARPGLGAQFGDLRAFINSLPANTSVGIGYMRNGTVQIAQNLTDDHDRAAQAIRLPLASSGAYGSPYLSVIDLMKRWPESSNRREIVMITDGIDRFRSPSRDRGLRSVSPDVSSASIVAQRTGTIVHTIFTPTAGRHGANFWAITNGQNSMAKLSAETGGESFFVGTQTPVSFRPYLDSLQKSFSHRYLLEFNALPGNTSGLQTVKLTTEVAGVELDSADSVWVKAR